MLMQEKMRTQRQEECPNSRISEIYGLVHPLYYVGSEPQYYDPKTYFDIWKESLTQASEKSGVFAIVERYYERTEGYLNHLEEQLIKHAKSCFPEHRLWCFRDSLLSTGVFNDEIRERLTDRKKVKVSGRGSFARACVHGFVQSTLDAYNIPLENGSIDWLESPDTNEGFMGYRVGPIFPNAAERERKKQKMNKKQYNEWLEATITKFSEENPFDGSWENNFSLRRIKTYLGDRAHLQKQFADLRYEVLEPNDFNDEEKAERIAVAYQFLATPFGFYDCPRKKPLPDRFHVNPSFQSPHKPKPWEANADEVSAFSQDLATYLGLNVTFKQDQVESIVTKALTKRGVILTVGDD